MLKVNWCNDDFTGRPQPVDADLVYDLHLVRHTFVETSICMSVRVLQSVLSSFRCEFS